MIVKHSKGCLETGGKTLVMGILNVTPDSFYDGGKHYELESALNHARKMIEDGADIIDIGGESTRPGSSYVTADEELLRVIPVIRELSKETDKPISIDTHKAIVAGKAIEAGAQIVNDISGLQADEEMVRVVAANDIPIVIMHIKGQPHNFPKYPKYHDVISEIILFLKKQIDYAVESGIAHNNIIIDPGIGFGKTYEQNLEILKRLDELKSLDRPILIGASRKSFINHVLGEPRENSTHKTNSQLIGTLVTLVIAITKGANVLRVHDIRETVQVSKMVKQLN